MYVIQLFLPNLCILVLKPPHFLLSVMCIPPSSISVFYVPPTKYPSSIFIPHFSFSLMESLHPTSPVAVSLTLLIADLMYIDLKAMHF